MPSGRAWSTDLNVTSSSSRKILPVVGGWKPQRILSRVDLPAPLSPIRPRTSPRPRWRLTSVRAVTAPYFLEMCSTRRMSPSGVWVVTSLPPSRRSFLRRVSRPSSLARSPEPGEGDAGDHRDDDVRAPDYLVRGRADPHEGVARLHGSKHT